MKGRLEARTMADNSPLDATISTVRTIHGQHFLKALPQSLDILMSAFKSSKGEFRRGRGISSSLKIFFLTLRMQTKCCSGGWLSKRVAVSMSMCEAQTMPIIFLGGGRTFSCTRGSDWSIAVSAVGIYKRFGLSAFVLFCLLFLFFLLSFFLLPAIVDLNDILFLSAVLRHEFGVNSWRAERVLEGKLSSSYGN